MCVEKGLRRRAVLRERHEVAENTQSECADPRGQLRTIRAPSSPSF